MEYTDLQPHQQRVIAERDELRDRISKLRKFLDGETPEMPAEEYRRLQLQLTIMTAYRAVLDERILNF